MSHSYDADMIINDLGHAVASLLLKMETEMWKDNKGVLVSKNKATINLLDALNRSVQHREKYGVPLTNGSYITV